MECCLGKAARGEEKTPPLPSALRSREQLVVDGALEGRFNSKALEKPESRSKREETAAEEEEEEEEAAVRP